MAEFDYSLFDYDVGFYQYTPGGWWLHGKLIENGDGTFTRRAVDAAINVDMDDSDVLIAAYPKTGQTWTMTIISLILQAKDLEEGKEADLDVLFDKIPFMELEWADGKNGADAFTQLKPPRFMKTHLPYELWEKQLKKHPNLRVIQTIRNPKDALVSYYHHARGDSTMGGFHGTWDQYFELFQKKMLPWGDFFEHSADWYKFNKGRENSLVIKYEDMKKDPKGYVAKIAKFIGHDLLEKAIDLVVENSKVKNASKKLNDMFPSWNKERSTFVRKGQVGDWVNYFSAEQIECVEAKSKEFFEPLGVKFEDNQ